MEVAILALQVIGLLVLAGFIAVALKVVAIITSFMAVMGYKPQKKVDKP